MLMKFNYQDLGDNRTLFAYSGECVEIVYLHGRGFNIRLDVYLTMDNLFFVVRDDGVVFSLDSADELIESLPGKVRLQRKRRKKSPEEVIELQEAAENCKHLF